MESFLGSSGVHLGVVGIIVQLIFLECILSIDNAAVMGAMVRHLPDDQPTPWPPRLRPFFAWTDRFMGPQRSAALKVGLFGAYAGRILMLVLASIIIKLTWVQVLGALYLLHLAVGHFVTRHLEAQDAASGAEGAHQLARRGGFWSVVLALNLADLAFSLDNVIAAVALSEELWVVILGVGIGILVMRFAATLFTKMIAWEPKLESGAYLLLFAIGGQLLLEKIFGLHIDDAVRFLLSLMILLLTITFARVKLLQPLLIIFRPAVILAVLVQTLVDGAFSRVQAALQPAARR
jgi:tellurite resistance protein TerC